MRHTRLISAAVGALFVASTAVGCSEAQDKLNDAKSKVDDAKSKVEGAKGSVDGLKGKANEALGKLSPEMKEKIGTALGDKLPPEVKDKLQGTLEENGITLDAGEHADEPAVTVGETYFGARQAAIVNGDFAPVKAVSNPKMLKRAKTHVKKRGAMQKGKPFKVTVVNVTGDVSQLCVGRKAQNPKAVTVKNDKVVNIKPGKFSCA